MDCSMIRLERRREALRRRRSPSTTRPSASSAARSSRCSGRPAAARRRCSASSPGFERPDAGTVEVAGRRRRRRRRPGCRPERRRVGMVFQDYALFPHLTVARERRLRPAAPRARRARRASCSTIVGLDGARAALPARALRRAAAAGRARARPRARARARPARRAVVERRPVPARDAARRGGRDHPPARRHGRARHARPRGGVLARRPHRAHARRRDRAGGHAGGALLRAGVALGGGVRRRGERPRRHVSSAGRVETPLGAFPANGASTDGRRHRCSSGPSCSSCEPDPAGAGGGRRARVPRPRRLLPRAPRRRRARLAAPVDRGRPARLPRLDPRCTTAACPFSTDTSVAICVRSPLHSQ